MTTIDDIKSIIRSREPPLTGAMCDILWADPLLEEVLGHALKDSDYEEVSIVTTFMDRYTEIVNSRLHARLVLRT